MVQAVMHSSEQKVDSVRQGRDANRKLQRAIKAGKARDRMPAVIEQMQSMLEAWAESEDRPFLYDERDYQVQLPPSLKSLL